MGIASNEIAAQNACVDFSGSDNEIYIHEHVTFTSKVSLACGECDSSMQAKAFVWKFEGGEPATALGPGPHQVRYTSFGNFDVEIEVAYIHPANFEQECKKSIVKKSSIAVIPKENVVLKSFNANSNNKRIILNWETVYEKNNEVFIVEKSNDNVTYNEIATVKSEGNKSILTDYNTDDKSPTKGLSYYRLKIKAQDGTITYSSAIAVKWIDINELLNIAEGEKVLVVIHDKDGNELYSKVVVKGVENDTIVAIDPLEKLEPGTYLIVGSSKNEIFNKQLVVKQNSK